MKTRINIQSLLFGALLGAGVVLTVAAAATGAAKKPGWEYRVVTGPLQAGPESLESRINMTVTKGYEFVAVGGAGNGSGFAVVRHEKE